MGFLDRLVSDLVANATGINTRGLVRRVGGKNILLVGGALLAGALANDSMRRTGGAGTVAPPRGAGLPPPPPGAGPSFQVPPPPPAGRSGLAGTGVPPPPLPAVPSKVDEPPPEVTYLATRAMIAAALADGELAAEEKRVIEGRLGESGLSDEQVAQIRRDLVVPASPAQLAASLPEGEDREMPYRFAAVVLLADGEVGEVERAWLARFAGELGIAPERCQELERELFPGR